MIKLFFSYSHKDEEMRNELETHLALLKRQGIIDSWHDRRITAGKDINKTISVEFESSKIVLLLVSAYFLASDYCYEKEMKRAIEKHKEGSAVVIPVIIHPCDWHSAPFGNLRATPTDGKPVSMYANQHEAFSIVAKDIREAAENVSQQISLPKSNHTPDKTVTTQGNRSSNLRIKRKFDDLEKDKFLEDSYEYIARYFEESLKELSIRNPQIETKFKRLDATSFAAFVYDNGKRIAECSIYYGKSLLGSSGIAYSSSANVQRNSLNESLSIVDNGYTLQLKPLGLQIIDNYGEKVLSQQGAAEYYWSLFIKPLQ